MNTFTNTLIASTLAVAVVGPASADVLFLDVFISDKVLKVDVKPSSCKNTKLDFATSTLVLTNEIADGEGGFEDLFELEEAGFWELEGFTWVEVESDLGGIYTTKKIDKDLTPSMFEWDLGDCIDVTDAVGTIQFCTGLAEVIQKSLIVQGCGAMTNVQSALLSVTKSQIKLSKKGDRAKVDFQVEGEYINTKNNAKAKKVKLTIKGKNYDKVGI